MIKKCKQCKKNWNAKRSINVFCSNSCSAKWKAKNYPPSSSQFKKSSIPWNKGKNISGMSGKKQTPEHREAIRLANLGEKSSNWKGGVTPANELFRKTAAYKQWRLSVFTRDNYTCKHCGIKSVRGNRIILNADHILPFALYPDLRLDVDNGRTLCIECHKKTDTYGNGAKAYTGQKAERV